MSAPPLHDPQVVAGNSSALRLLIGPGKSFQIDQIRLAQAAGPGLTGWIG